MPRKQSTSQEDIVPLLAPTDQQPQESAPMGADKGPSVTLTAQPSPGPLSPAISQTSGILGLTSSPSPSEPRESVYQVYKKRWLGVALIALLNFMTAFSIVIYAPIAEITRQHFLLANLTPINWLYISGAFVYVPASLATLYITQRSAKSGLIMGSMILILGSWLRYLGTRLQSYDCVLLGSILCGASQAFALNIPSHYSNLWFREGERVTATALMSLANPLGQAIGTLVVPFMATNPAQVSSMTLHVAILFTVSASFAGLTPARPWTPASASPHDIRQPIGQSLLALTHNAEFYYIFIQFAILVAAFNAFATLIEQFTKPYGFSDVQAGIIGAVLVVVGLVSGVATAPVLDRTKAYRLPIMLCIVASALSYLALIFAIRPFSITTFIVVLILAAVIGGSGLVLLPLALELATDVSLPVPPEMTSSILWMGGQALGGIFILIMDSMRTADSKYTHSMIFLVVMTSLPIPFAVALVRSKRIAQSRAMRRAGTLDSPVVDAS